MTRPVSSENNASTAENVILYLPPGPLKGLRRQDAAQSTLEHNAWPILKEDSENQLSPGGFSAETALSKMTSATVVTVNYRLGPPEPETRPTPIDETETPSPNESSEPQIHQYPTPVHDTLTALDWILNNLNPTKLGIFGSHIGGSLALMLALTEAKSVHAIAALDPICDWPGLDDYCITETDPETEKPSKRHKKHKQVAPIDLVPLLEARETYFSSFSRCFDPFASPILLLRSAGRDVPTTFPKYLTGPEYPVPVLENDITPERDEEWDGNMGITLDAPSPIRRRKALSRWPPYGLDYGSSGPSWSGPDYGVKRLEVELPWVRIFSSGSGSSDGGGKTHAKNPLARSTVLGHQAEEMVSAMQRACFWGREKGFGERRVTLSRVDENLGRDVRKYFEDVFGTDYRDD